jgi:hypothetical protein
MTAIGIAKEAVTEISGVASGAMSDAMIFGVIFDEKTNALAPVHYR